MADHTIPGRYPFIEGARPGELHLRAYANDLGDSRRGDVAAMAAALLDDGVRTVVCATSSSVPALIGTIGHGWREPLLEVVAVDDLLGATAALYRAWSKHNGEDIAILIEDAMHLSTSAFGGHDDAVMRAWALGAAWGTPERLRSLTGLDYATYAAPPSERAGQVRADHGSPGAAPASADDRDTSSPDHEGHKRPAPGEEGANAPEAIVVLGMRYRKGGAGERAPMMGGFAIQQSARTITRIEVLCGDDHGVRGRALSEKSRRSHHLPPTPLRRTAEPAGPWQVDDRSA